MVPVAINKTDSKDVRSLCPLKILIADDHEVVRRGIREILSEIFPEAEFREAVDGRQALDQMHRNQFDFALLDLAMPQRTGIDVVLEIRKFNPTIPIFILSMYPPDQISQRALRAGATAYLTKDRVAEDLVDVVQKVLDGEEIHQCNPCKVSVDELSLPRHGMLSPREFQVLCGIGAGKPLKLIAIDTLLDAKTVSTYRLRVLQKMGMTTNAELIAYVLQHNLLSDPYYS